MTYASPMGRVEGRVPTLGREGFITHTGAGRYHMPDQPVPGASSRDACLASFGRWLREMRIQRRLNVTTAAEQTGITRQQWHRLEHGLSGTSRETIPHLAETLGVDEHEVALRAGFAPELPNYSEPIYFSARDSSTGTSDPISIGGDPRRAIEELDKVIEQHEAALQRARAAKTALLRL